MSDENYIESQPEIYEDIRTNQTNTHESFWTICIKEKREQWVFVVSPLIIVKKGPQYFQNCKPLILINKI